MLLYNPYFPSHGIRANNEHDEFMGTALLVFVELSAVVFQLLIALFIVITFSPLTANASENRITMLLRMNLQPDD